MAERKPLRLRVLVVNPEKSLYERLGFSVTTSSPTHHYTEYLPWIVSVTEARWDVLANPHLTPEGAEGSHTGLMLRSICVTGSVTVRDEQDGSGHGQIEILQPYARRAQTPSIGSLLRSGKVSALAARLARKTIQTDSLRERSDGHSRVHENERIERKGEPLAVGENGDDDREVSERHESRNELCEPNRSRLWSPPGQEQRTEESHRPD